MATQTRRTDAAWARALIAAMATGFALGATGCLAAAAGAGAGVGYAVGRESEEEQHEDHVHVHDDDD